MSRIIKNIINSSIEDEDSSPKRLLYYASEDEDFNDKLFSLPFIFYTTKDSDKHRERGNVYFYPNALSEFLSITLDAIIFTYPNQFNQANNIAHQLHINNIFLCKDLPLRTKIEDIYYFNQMLEKNCSAICFSQELADKWLLSEYSIISSFNDIEGIIRKWTRLYIRK